MTDHSPIMMFDQAAYSIKEAAALVGKSDITIVRWCRDGVFPNAGKIPGPKGDEWSISAEDLAAVVEAKKLTIHLDQSEPVDDPASDRALAQAQEEVIGLLKENAELREKTGHLNGQNEQLTERVKRLGDDLEHAQSEWQRAATDRDRLAGETDALRNQLEKAERERAQSAQERDSLDQKYLELEKRSAESLSAASDDLEAVVVERDELTTKLAKAEASMGWWTRRRYGKS